MLRAAVGVLAAALAIRRGAAAELEWPNADCDVLTPNNCWLPFPSNIHTVADEGSAVTGRRVNFLALPQPSYFFANFFGTEADDPALLNSADGFAVATPMVLFFPCVDAARSKLADWQHISETLEASSPTVLIDAETQERVPHFAELDSNSLSDATSPLMIRPAAALAPGRRYIVAVRDLISSQTGIAIAPSTSFLALREGKAKSDPAVKDREALYEDIFERLAAAGVERDTLQLAWDFSTASTEFASKDLLQMRDDALQSLGAGYPEYMISSVQEGGQDPLILRQVSGLITVPLFLAENAPRTKLVRNDQGRVVSTQDAQFEFTMVIPRSALERSPDRAVVYGHGLFRTQADILHNGIPAMQNALNLVSIGVDFLGLADPNRNDFTTGVTDGRSLLDVIQTLSDQLMQSLVNVMFAARLITGTGIVRDAAVGLGPDAEILSVFYAGGSLGGILGPSLLATVPEFTRGVLVVPGQPWFLVLERSSLWEQVFDYFALGFEEDVDVQLWYALGAQVLQSVMPSAFSNSLLETFQSQSLAGIPDAGPTALIVTAVGDRQVPTLGAHIMARTLNAEHLAAPSNRTVFGLDRVASFDSSSKEQRSVLVEFDFGMPEPVVNVPAEEQLDENGQVRGDPHNLVAVMPGCIDLIVQYLQGENTLVFLDDDNVSPPVAQKDPISPTTGQSDTEQDGNAAVGMAAPLWIALSLTASLLVLLSPCE